MSQTKFNELLESNGGKLPAEFANSIIHTRAEDVNLSQLRTKVLWTNPNPNTAFDSQTVELSDGNYDYLLFIYSFRLMSNADPIQQSVIVDKNAKSTALNYYSPSTDLTYHAGGTSRNVTINNSTSITFSDNIHANNATTKAVVSNGLGIPIQIIGLYKSPAMIYTGAELYEGNGISIDNGVISGNYGRLLWTNDSPTNGFSAQTVSANLTDYNLVYISFFTRAYSDKGIYDSRIITKNTKFNLLSFDLDGNRKYRGVTATNSGITFDSGRSTDDCVPYQIYGLKIGV